MLNNRIPTCRCYVASHYGCYVITGTENAADEESRKRIAVDADTGGSYVVSRN